MKRFIGITSLFIVGFLAAWVIFDTFASSPPGTKSDNTPFNATNVTDETAESQPIERFGCSKDGRRYEDCARNKFYRCDHVRSHRHDVECKPTTSSGCSKDGSRYEDCACIRYDGRDHVRPHRHDGECRPFTR